MVLATRNAYADSAAFGVASIRVTVGLLSDTCFKRTPPRPAAVSDAYTTRSQNRGATPRSCCRHSGWLPNFRAHALNLCPFRVHTVNVLFHLSGDWGLRLSVYDRAYIGMCYGSLLCRRCFYRMGSKQFTHFCVREPEVGRRRGAACFRFN